MVRCLRVRFAPASSVALLIFSALGTTVPLHVVEYLLRPVYLLVPFAAGGRIGRSAAAKSSPDNFAAFLTAEGAKWSTVTRVSGITGE